MFAIFDCVAFFLWLAGVLGVSKSVKKLEKNLARVISGQEKYKKFVSQKVLLNRAIRSHFRYYADNLTDTTITKEQVDARVRTSGAGAEALLENAAQGKSSIISLGHSGNWDLAGAWANMHLGRVVAVAEKLKSEEMLNSFIEYREKLGMTIYKLGTKNILSSLVEEVSRDKTCVTLVSDRDLSSNGVAVKFFSDEISMAKGPALVAMKTGVTLFQIFISYEKLKGQRRKVAKSKWGIVIDVASPVGVDVGADMRDAPAGVNGAEVRAVMQECADKFASKLSKHPEDWHVLHRIFLSDLDKTPRRS
jgi:KDO2-lipid IV(A) lauroyltransferase